MALTKFEPPTELQKREWAKSEVVDRGEFGGHVYELSKDNRLFVLERDTARPTKAGQVGYLNLVGVINEPTETLIKNVTESSTWL